MEFWVPQLSPISIMIRYLQLMLLATLLLLFAASSSAATLPPGEGKAIVQRTCVSCHALKVVTAKRASKEQWSTLVDQMISRGADLSDDEVEIVVDYLAKNFGPAKNQTVARKSHSKRFHEWNQSRNQIPAINCASVPNRNQIPSQRMAQFVEGARD